jgi:signal peptidase II
MPWVVLIAATIAALDQATKWLIVRCIHPDESRIVVPGFFDLVHVLNSGAAWGMFRGYNWVLTAVCILAIIGLYLFRHSFQLHRPGPRLALGLIAGGIIGNLIDRVRVGHVIDFLSFYIGQYHWPAFNVADSSMCVGVTLFVILSWRSERAASKTNATA